MEGKLPMENYVSQGGLRIGGKTKNVAGGVVLRA